ncbi:MAG TPA: N-acyl homoserine lactonase family protein [Gemmatimonadaceae bacterium]|nr:N-acyl homoserine lactonase family protein [Gemmatimonadaceae bacterium]
MLSLLLAVSLLAAPPRYQVYAVRYATVPNFPLRGLVAGAPRGERTDLAMTLWVIRDPAPGGRVILFDAGFYRDKFIEQWKPRDYVRPDRALAPLGINPGDVTDLVISHIHWDHADGADLFPKARVWLQTDEYDHYVGPGGAPLDRAIDSLDAAMLFSLHAAGRVHLIPGDSTEVFPGIYAYLGGKHTYASEYLSVPTRSGVVVLASDNVYLYRNLDEHRPIAQTLDSLSNLAAQQRMLKLAARPALIVPGHDPTVFDRFPKVAPHIVRID